MADFLDRADRLFRGQPDAARLKESGEPEFWLTPKGEGPSEEGRGGEGVAAGAGEKRMNRILKQLKPWLLILFWIFAVFAYLLFALDERPPWP